MERADGAAGPTPDLDLDQVFDRVDEHREELIQRLVAYAGQPSVSSTGEGIAEAAELACNVKVLLDGEEELGSPNLPAFVEGHKDLLGADLAIWSDGPVHESGRWCLVFGVRGIVTFELRARGANRLDLGRVLASLGLERLDEPADRGFYERLVAWPTFTVNGLRGGYGGPGTQTVLPNEAVAKCDVRLVPDQRTSDVLAKLEAHVARHAPGVELVRGGHMEPSRTPIDSRFTEPLRQAMVAALGEEPLLVPPLGGSLPAYVFTDILGLPTFGVPFANADQTNHAPNEDLEIERFIGGIKAAASMLAHLGAMRPL